MSFNTRFRCSNETVKGFYSLFDILYRGNEDFREAIRKGTECYINKNFLGECSLLIGNTDATRKSYPLDKGILDALNAKGIFEGNNSYSDLFMLRYLYFSDSYLYDMSDVCRSSEWYGITGERQHYSNSDIVFSPLSNYRYSDICEVRSEYADIVPNGYKKMKLPESFKKITSNEEYKELFRGKMSKGYMVNRLFENYGTIFCGNRVVGYTGLEDLKGVESDFYNELLELVVGLADNINSVRFYSDLNWSCILCRDSKVKGELELVIK